MGNTKRIESLVSTKSAHDLACMVIKFQDEIKLNSLIHVGFTNPYQIKYAKNESGLFYPDTDHGCFIPLYMMNRHKNRLF